MNYLIVLSLILTPTYAVRFSLFGFSTNLLMVWIFFVWLITIVYLSTKNQWQEFVDYIKNLDKKLLVLIGLFFLAGLVSLSVKGFDQKKLGQFIVLFLQPISLFFISGFVSQKSSKIKDCLLLTAYCLLTLMGIYAIIQYFTLLGLPSQYWGNNEEPKRALSFFVHPNFYALFSAPLLALLIPDMFHQFSIFNFQFSKLWKLVFWSLGASGLLLSLSRAGWFGLGMAGLIYLIIAADVKIRKFASVIVIVMVIIILSTPNLRWRFTLPFYGEKSAVSRISLWHTGVKAVKESPILGLGLTGFAKNWDRLNTDPNIDRHNFPHNIFLDFWVETGFLGLITFTGLIGLFIYRGLHPVPPLLARGGDGGGVEPWSDNKIIGLSISLFLVAVVFQGILDNPYFKNDLAMVFWMVLALAI